jgi:hypothetical protein
MSFVVFLSSSRPRQYHTVRPRTLPSKTIAIYHSLKALPFHSTLYSLTEEASLNKLHMNSNEAVNFIIETFPSLTARSRCAVSALSADAARSSEPDAPPDSSRDRWRGFAGGRTERQLRVLIAGSKVKRRTRKRIPRLLAVACPRQFRHTRREAKWDVFTTIYSLWPALQARGLLHKTRNTHRSFLKERDFVWDLGNRAYGCEVDCADTE